jgi:hypothetical protein
MLLLLTAAVSVCGLVLEPKPDPDRRAVLMSEVVDALRHLEVLVDEYEGIVERKLDVLFSLIGDAEGRLRDSRTDGGSWDPDDAGDGDAFVSAHAFSWLPDGDGSSSVDRAWDLEDFGDYFYDSEEFWPYDAADDNFFAEV